MIASDESMLVGIKEFAIVIAINKYPIVVQSSRT